MKRFFVIIIVLMSLSANKSICSENGAASVSIPGITTVTATLKSPPPSWAVMQRNLIRTMEDAAPLYLKKFTYRGGTMTESAKLDDDYECFDKWVMLYIIGGDEKLLNAGLTEWNAITRYWENTKGGVYKEFVAHNDMLHLSEGYIGFQYFGLADPKIPENIERSKRFAGFYLGEDPGADNYDPAYKVIKGIATGSKGPSDKYDASWYNISYGHVSLEPFVKDSEIEWDWDKKPERREELIDLYDKIATPCDYPLNTAITGLVTNAYIYTGDEKYKKWVLDYVDAWLERIKQNDGIIPDNIGRTGKIGEYRSGQWWGGTYGWTSRYSVHIITTGLITAMQCAYLLSGDPKYVDLLRSQSDMLLSKAKDVRGQLLIPYKYSSGGWYDYRPMHTEVPAYIWQTSLEKRDLDTIERIAAGTKYNAVTKPDIGDGRPKPGTETWEPDLSSKADPLAIDRTSLTRNGCELPHALYLAGKNPSWPEDVLRAESQNVTDHIQRLLDDSWESSWKSQTTLQKDPVLTNGLVQMTMGATTVSFNGGLLMAPVRYFDPDRARPGLPPDVAALVEKTEQNLTVINLVNTGVIDSKRVLVQGGAFGEHSFTGVKYTEYSAGVEKGIEKTTALSGNVFVVELPPGTSIKLEIGTKRFANRPTYEFPWEKIANEKR